MANDVFANGREISCKAADGKSIAAFPDVCFTPPECPATPPGVPIPYPNTAFASDTTEGSKSVKISGKEVMLKNKSYFKKSTGDEAGCAQKKGIITSKISGKVYFTAWSMDVKIEGQNVVRHLDLTTHNHGSPPANEGLPWTYIDAMAADADTPQSCKDMVSDIKDNCPDGKIYKKKCCDARKCLLLPKEPNQCCNGPDGKQMTGHHPLPSKEFVAHAGRSKPDPVTGYVSNKAPCICVQGHSHNEKTEHGQVGCNYTRLKREWIKDVANIGKTYTAEVGYEIGAKSIIGNVKLSKGAKGCDEECLKKQLEHGHNEMKTLKVKKNDPLPRSKQPPKIKGGKKGISK